jgi:hypothetical protein
LDFGDTKKVKTGMQLNLFQWDLPSEMVALAIDPEYAPAILTVGEEHCNLAELYGVETKAFKQAVQRNIERFPGDFMFVIWFGARGLGFIFNLSVPPPVI